MIEQQARVINSDNGRVLLEIGAQSGCPACDAGEGCGAGLFGKLLKRSPARIELDEDGSCHPGQVVQVGLAEATFLKLVFSMYGAPLLGGLAGAAAGLGVSQFLGLEGGVLDLLVLSGALLIAWLVLKFRNRTLKPELSDKHVQVIRHLQPATACGGSGFQQTKR